MIMRQLMHITGLFFLFLLPWGTLYSQTQATTPVPVDPDTKKIMYRAVVDQEGTSGYLYDKAIEWFRAYYLNPTSVFSVQDRTNGKIEGTGRMKIYYSDPDGTKMDGGVVLYNIKIELKENKYRYTLTDFLLKATSRYPLEKWLNKNDPAYNPQWDSYLYQVDTTMQNLVVKLKAGMKPTVKKTDEW
jgi:hypothetical protein